MSVNSGSVGNTRLLPRAKMLLVPMNISLTGRLCSGGVYILTEQTSVAACFMLRGRDTHIDFLWLLFLVDMMICPLMQVAFSFTSFKT